MTARADYIREWRNRRPENREKGAAQTRAYQAAQRRLRENHRAEFDAIYAEERCNQGLDG